MLSYFNIELRIDDVLFVDFSNFDRLFFFPLVVKRTPFFHYFRRCAAQPNIAHPKEREGGALL